MSYFLGFFPDEKANFKIRKVVGEVGRVFKDFDIPVRWVKPETFHITLYFLGDSMSPLRKLLLKRSLFKINVKPFNIVFNKVKLGISRQQKGLVYLDLEEGGEKLRELLLDIRKIVGVKDLSSFVPHLTIGRVSKDLSDEEYRNLVKDISNISKNLNISDISFEVRDIYLVRSDQGNYSVVMKFETKSTIF